MQWIYRCWSYARTPPSYRNRVVCVEYWLKVRSLSPFLGVARVCGVDCGKLGQGTASGRGDEREKRSHIEEWQRSRRGRVGRVNTISDRLWQSHEVEL
jgi:hypothetical protein